MNETCDIVWMPTGIPQTGNEYLKARARAAQFPKLKVADLFAAICSGGSDSLLLPF